MLICLKGAFHANLALKRRERIIPIRINKHPYLINLELYVGKNE